MPNRGGSRTPEVPIHIGRPFLPYALCGARAWTVLVHYDSLEGVPTDRLAFCRECVRIHGEQRSARKAVAARGI
jgi:hypothetical protein